MNFENPWSSDNSENSEENVPENGNQDVLDGVEAEVELEISNLDDLRSMIAKKEGQDCFDFSVLPKSSIEDVHFSSHGNLDLSFLLDGQNNNLKEDKGSKVRPNDGSRATS